MPTITETSVAMTPKFARVVNVSSEGHRHFAPACGVDFSSINLSSSSTSPWTRYGQSKLAVILHITSLNEKYGFGKEQGEAVEAVGDIWTASVHPGSVQS